MRVVGLLMFLASACGLFQASVPSDEEFASAAVGRAGDVEVQALTRPDPPVVTGNTLWLRVTERGLPWEGEPTAMAQMPAMGAMAEMRAPAATERVSAGTYRATFDLPMTGSWTLQVGIGATQIPFSLTVGRSGLLSDEPAADQPSTPGAVHIGAARRQEFAIRTGEARKASLVVDIRAPGRVAYAQSGEKDVVSRVSGTIVDLRVDRTGDSVVRGQVLLRLDSPELETAQRQHALAAAGADSDLLAASRARLLRLGLLDSQIDAIEKGRQPPEVVELRAPANGTVVHKDVVEGASVEPGTRLFRLANLDRVWVEADLYESDVPRVTVGMPATVRTASAVHEGAVELLQPEADPITRTRIARVPIDGEGSDLFPGALVEVTLHADLGERLVVPDTAVLYTGPRRIVFVDRGPGGLVPVEVTIGARGDGVLEVTSGLVEGDLVVTSGAFLVAAESRIRSTSVLWEAADGSPLE